MPRSVTLTNLTEDIRQRADLPTFSTTTFITSTAVTRMINQSLQALYSLVMNAFGDGYFTKTGSLTATANTATTSLPSDFLRMVALVWNRGTDDIIPVLEADAEDGYVRASYAARSWDSPRYRLRHSALVWVPMPIATQTLTIEYVYAPADLSSGSDTFDGGPGWDEWVALDVCRKIREREEKDASDFVRERARVEAMILTQSPYRQETQNKQIRDVWGSEALGTRDLRNRMWRGVY